MNKTTIFYKSKNILIEQLEKQSNIEVLKEKNFFSKIFSSKRFPDIYFHSGILDEDSKDVVVMSSLLGLTTRQISFVKGFSIGKVNYVAHNGFNSLKRKLSNRS